jgi:putative redox protein
MPVETVRVDWIQDQEFELKDRFGFPIRMAQPGGANAADLLPLSVIGCAACDLASLLRKQRQRVTALQVTAESEREAAPPWRFLKIHIRYRIAGRDLKEEAVRRAIDLTEQKYCATFATLRRAVEITTACEIVEDKGEPRGSAGG